MSDIVGGLSSEDIGEGKQRRWSIHQGSLGVSPAPPSPACEPPTVTTRTGSEWKVAGQHAQQQPRARGAAAEVSLPHPLASVGAADASAKAAVVNADPVAASPISPRSEMERFDAEMAAHLQQLRSVRRERRPSGGSSLFGWGA